ncbi:MAG: (d)CMP kinase [Hyphomicrobiaceae bacterium]
MTIAIDGPAASGKGTLARLVAEHYGLACLDTGLLYRAVARDVMEADLSLEDEAAAAAVARALDPRTLDDHGLRLPSIGDAASVVAKFPAVRSAILDFQRDFAAQEPGAVLDGRDIGTVVLPDANVKIYVTADVETRARRRYDEQKGRGEPVTFERVLETIRARDERDMSRQASPLRPAGDAVILDTTHMNVTEAFEAALEVIQSRIGK